jgi:hypothetical protein
MSTISWGKPTLKAAPVVNGTFGAIIEFPTPVQDSTQLTPEKGNKLEAPLEGGALADVRYDKNKYSCELELYRIKGSNKPIKDNDGIVEQEYALFLIPEDPTNEGFIMRRSSVSVEETWAANIGHKWKYTFEALQPIKGKLLESLLPVSSSELSFANTADTTGKTVNVTSDIAITATSDQAWATVTVSSKVVTVKVAANAGAERTANVLITSDEKVGIISVKQAAGA